MTQEAVVHETGEVVLVEDGAAAAPRGIFGDDPKQALEMARQLVAATDSLIRSRRSDFIAVIGGREYPKADWWTAMGQPLGLSPVVVWVKRAEGFASETWEARVEVRNRDGAVVSSGQAVCSRDEPNWKRRDSYALYSMAQTRATAKAYRLPLSFLAVLSGLAPTPAEEMTPEFANTPEPDQQPRDAHKTKVAALKAFWAAWDNDVTPAVVLSDTVTPEWVRTEGHRAFLRRVTTTPAWETKYADVGYGAESFDALTAEQVAYCVNVLRGRVTEVAKWLSEGAPDTA